MRVTNRCSFSVVAAVMCNDSQGAAIRIEPGDTGEVFGPRVHEFHDERADEPGAGCIIMDGEVTVHEAPDDEVAMQVTEGNPLTLGRSDGRMKIIVCHPSEVG